MINPGSQMLYEVPDTQRDVMASVSVWSFTTNCAFYLKPSSTTTAGGKSSELGLPIPVPRST